MVRENVPYYHLLNSIPVLIPDFDNPFPVTGTGMENCIPQFWEREQEWKEHSQLLGTGTGMKKSSIFLEREWEAGIPRNGREREFSLTPDRLWCYIPLWRVIYKHINQRLFWKTTIISTQVGNLENKGGDHVLEQEFKLDARVSDRTDSDTFAVCKAVQVSSETENNLMTTLTIFRKCRAPLRGMKMCLRGLAQNNRWTFSTHPR